jgi:hypothetical protein
MMEIDRLENVGTVLTLPTLSLEQMVPERYN